MFTALSDRIGARPGRSILAVLAFVLLAGVLGGPVAGELEDSGGFAPPDAGSSRAKERIVGASGTRSSAGVVLLVDTPAGARAPAGRKRVATLRAQLVREPGIVSVATAQSTGDAAFVSRDGRSTFLDATLDADAGGDAVASGLTDRFKGQDDVTLGGSLFADTQIGDRITADLGRAELLAFPLLFLLSLLFFRGRATVLPLVVGIFTVLGTFLALRVVNEVYGLSIFALNLVIGLGIGLAIDYTLFLVTRYREELERHGPGLDGVRATMRTAGRTVVFSALTVSFALITLTLFPLGFAKSMAIAGAVVALVAGVGALIISPALFALWGSKLAIRRRRERAEQEGAWYRLSHAVMRRPGRVAVVTTLVMLAAAIPAVRAQFTPVDASTIPISESSRTVADALQRDFPGQRTSPVTVVIDAPGGAPEDVRAYASGLRDLAGVKAVAEARALDASTWLADVSALGEPDGPTAQGVVERVRSADAPFPVLVGGAAAEFVDQQDAIASRLPLAIGVLALLTFAVLWVMTGSLILPLKALVMNFLTVATALGVLTLIFQDGRLEGLLNYTSNGGVEPTDFLVTAALVFALSTDYGVFLLGRIKEAREAGLTERESVAVGLERTGAVVTAAAILLAVAIGAFSTSSISFIQQIGIATATGVLVDAFIVRALLVPSLMALLGRWNWWSPAWMRKGHDRLRFSE